MKDTEDVTPAAWAAYLDSQPLLRKELENKKFLAGLAEIRRRGLVAQA